MTAAEAMGDPAMLLAWSAALEHEHVSFAEFVEREEEEPERRQTSDV